MIAIDRWPKVPSPRRGLTIAETLTVVVSLVAALAFLLPALGQVGQTVPLSGSRNNLRTLHAALECYAADWNGRQFTAVLDDLGVVEGDSDQYAGQFGCYPPLFAGRGCNLNLYAFWGRCDGFIGNSCHPNVLSTRPLWFNVDFPMGVFRIPQVKPIHDYLNGRFYDPVFYAPLDRKKTLAARPAFNVDCEFVEDVGTIPSSYMFSPAAMYHPDVMRAASAGGFQDPETLDHGFQSPGLSQARYPGLKTWMIEHSWLRHPPGPCNPDYDDIYGAGDGCDPYLYNHGADADPLALFYDGSVEALRTGDVVADDATVLDQTGGVDGLWSRDTVFGPTGYYGDASFDGTVVSHHVLTTGGILGRDRLTRPAPARRNRGAP